MGFVSVEDGEGVSIGFSQQIRCVSVSVYKLPTKEFDYIKLYGYGICGS